jgi:hypothetical protein
LFELVLEVDHTCSLVKKIRLQLVLTQIYDRNFKNTVAKEIVFLITNVFNKNNILKNSVSSEHTFYSK